MGLLDRIFSAIGLGKRDPSDPTSDQAAEQGEPTQARAAAATSEAADSDSGPDSGPESGPESAPDSERDPELEAQDDFGSFDFAHDIARFFTAEFRIEQAWASRERRDQLLFEYQVRDAAHWYQIKATFERWLQSPEGKAKYPSEASLTQARMTTTQTVTLDELELAIEDARRAKGG